MVIVSAVSALLLLQSTSFADTALRFKHHSDAYSIMNNEVPAADGEAKTWIGTDKARIDQGGDTSIIVHLKDNVVFFIDNKAKTYSELSLENLLGQVKEALTGEQSSGEENAALSAMMQGLMQVVKISVTVTPGSEKRKIGAWNCQKYTINQSLGVAGTSISEVWASPDIKVDPEFYAKFRNFAFVKFAGFDEAVVELKKIKGAPVFISSASQVMNTSIKSTEELVDVRESPAPSGWYDIPKGYKKAEE
jgi:hypothetical protein